MATLRLHAFGFAATFDLQDLVDTFADASVLQDSDKDRVIVRFGPPEALTPMALLYDFGAVVFVGLDRATCERHVQALTRRLPPEPHRPLEEEYLLEARPGAPVEVGNDRVVVPVASLAALDIVGLLLAQSVVMDYYEEDVRDILRKTDAITATMARKGRPAKARSLGKFIGTCMATRNDILSTLALFDKPESTWEHPELDRLYTGMRLEFEIDDRFRSLEMRLQMIQDNLMLFIEVAQSRSAWRLELTIVLLIVFEILLTLSEKVMG